MVNKKSIEFFSFFLKRKMFINIYGSSKGYPVLVFPTQDGTEDDYESFGMIETLKPYIEGDIIEIFTVNSIDKETFSAEQEEPSIRLNRHKAYENYIIYEVVPFIHQRNHSTVRILLTGNSMGGFHSASFFLKRPDLFSGCISLSGVYDAACFFNGLSSEEIKKESPISLLKEYASLTKIKQYQERMMILCIGRGKYEEEGLISQPILEEEIKKNNIPSFIDYWGYDVDHDWYWWKKMIVYLLPKMLAYLQKQYPKKLLKIDCEN